MSYVVVGYPKIDVTDFDWIQNIRQQYDLMQFTVVKPHVTFVFPTTKLEKDTLVDHVKSKSSGIKAFQVKLDSAKIVEDDSKTYFHAFLIPSIGLEEITQLHDVLYTDSLEGELRLDIPFIPHLGIGNNPNKKIMEELVNTINKPGISIAGEIDTLTVSEYDGSKVIDVQQIPLVR